MENKKKFPTEIFNLPSKGLVYPKENPLSSGKIELKYMTAKEEDILTNINFIKQGIVLDKLMQSMIVSDVDYDDLIGGDRDGIMIACRVLGYGKDYSFKYKDEEITIDLTQLQEKEINESLFNNKNEFEFTLPTTNNKITFKFLTGKDEKNLTTEINGLKKINKNISADLSTRLKFQIISINGIYDTKTIRDFVDHELLAQDSRALRKYIKDIQPGIELKFTNDMGEDVNIPMGVDFFWPDAGI
jgi:hypothetical protein